MSNARDPFIKNGFYHITNKSFGNKTIRRVSQDYETFIQYIISNLVEYSSLDITGYCLLPDHFHLIIKNGETGYDVSEFMRKIQISYAMYYKKKYAYEGQTKGIPVFGQRFKADLIENENDLKKSEGYINFNFLHHKLTHTISDWPYTSLHQLMDTGYQPKHETHIKILGSAKAIIDHMEIKMPQYEL